jgi:probable F420-dependent oxidoreductase
MLVDATLTDPIERVGAAAARAEAQGASGLWVGETNGDPLLRALLAAATTREVTVGTSVAIAFARSPMQLAYTGHDLARLARGRFVLGLGTQVKTHIERRFSMPWSQPSARLREYVAALRAIWRSWQEGTKLDFAGDFYTHDVMPPFFAPAAHEWGPPPVYLAGVGRRMTEVAGEVADGFFVHPFTTRAYLTEVTAPALAVGRAKRRETGRLVLALPAITVVGETDEALEAAVRATKRQIAFYASTPAYRPVLDLHGWGELQPVLTALSKRGAWKEMAGEISDEMLSAFAVVGNVDQVVAGLRGRWSGIVDRISLYTPYRADTSQLSAVTAGLRQDT